MKQQWQGRKENEGLKQDDDLSRGPQGEAVGFSLGYISLWSNCLVGNARYQHRLTLLKIEVEE